MWSSALLCGGAVMLATAVQAQTSLSGLKYVGSLSLHVPEIGLTEPSGLAVDPAGTGFWIVSDDTDTVFRLGADGDLQRVIGEDDRLRDLEGVTVDPVQNRLLVVSERTASLISVDLSPPHRLSRFPVIDMDGADRLSDDLQDRGNGLEGIAYDPATRTVFLIKEAKPSMLIEVTPDLDQVASAINLDKAWADRPAWSGDASGLAFDPQRQGLWVLSDTASTVRFLPRNGDGGHVFPLTWEDDGKTRQLDNAEGVALSPDGRSLFVLSDDKKRSRLVHYEIVTENQVSVPPFGAPE